MPSFTHLHLHTQYSLLDGATHIDKLISKVKENEMDSVAITDHGNMYGVFKFAAEAHRQKIKPIIGCEFYLAKDRMDHKDRVRYHQVLLAKDAAGYKNLTKLCSLGFLEGMYYKPRIDKALIADNIEGLIATTCCLQGEIPKTIINKGEDEAEVLFKEWLDLFGEDYYIELQRHQIDDQDKVNEVLIKWAKKYNVKMIATNDVHYLNEEDAEAHDILLCLQTGKELDDPKRMRFSSNRFFFKTQDEMAMLFKDLPEALENTQEVSSKITPLDLKRDILLPNFKLPEKFKTESEYLKHLAYEGGALRYDRFDDVVKTRLDYELEMVEKMGFAGYFLIVQDFVRAAKELGVVVGPGRGSVAGSAIAYAVGITNIEPIKYNLIFERFLNPERVNMPDIDIDFDDDGRQKVLDYITESYGRDQVAPIITFGTMKAKMAIRDVARVLKLPLSEADRIAKMVPDGPKITLKDAFKQNPELAAIRKKGSLLAQRTLHLAEILEGSVRHAGIHAAGIIIAPKKLMDSIPVCTSTGTEMQVTQFEGKYIEDAGMLKMDFLGLTTLNIIKDSVEDIERNHGVKIDINKIPLDDPKTFQLYQAGDTVGTFQFESDGMRAYLKQLVPTNIEDLIAMNALYRPGPMEFIPEFIERKFGRKKIVYPHELLRPILENTYGIMVYQEQIMQTAREMAGFTLAAADILRRAMGKKNTTVMMEQKRVFISGAKEKGIEEKTAEEVFGLMERFAEYGFNRSHSTAYSVLAFQTGYLKANYPAEYMAAVLTHNMSNLKKVDYYLNACKQMNLEVLGPDVNESYSNFTVNSQGNVRFGLAALKGVGEKAMDEIVKERNESGSFSSIFDLVKRVNLKSVNKRSLESLVDAGALDCFSDVHRAQYFHRAFADDPNLIERSIKLGSLYQSKLTSGQNSLFGKDQLPEIKEPEIHECEPWSELELLNREKEVTGIFISGHPLNDYRSEIDNFCSTTINAIHENKNKDVTIAGLVTKVRNGIDRNGKQYGIFELEDFTDKIDLFLFQEDYLKMKHFLNEGECLFVNGKWQQRRNNEDRYDLRIKQLMLLSDVKDKLLKEIRIEISLPDISVKIMDDLKKIIDENPGKCLLKLKINDESENISVVLPSKKIKMKIDNDILVKLNEIEGLKIKLN